jgi:hypothetical protein
MEVPMDRFPLRLSTPGSRIHAAVEVTQPDGRVVTFAACGIALASTSSADGRPVSRLQTHGIGPTCSHCKRAMSR